MRKARKMPPIVSEVTDSMVLQYESQPGYATD